jgi:prepilin signal peptidase PulO-like enzyme (type II secretory pathway)
MDWMPLIFVCFGLLLIGASIGSFLNVVVHRLPRGMGLIAPASHCPSCGRPIRFRDNVPVWGWLWLRGRCRDCGTAISPRYPLVELVTAVALLIAGLSALRIRDASLDDWTWMAKTAYDAILLCTLLAAALIRWDSRQPPLRLFWPANVVAVLAPVLIPALQAELFPILCSRGAWPLDRALGGVLGLAWGALLSREEAPSELLALRRSAAICLMLIGLFWGAWMVTVLTLAAVTAAWLAQRLGHGGRGVLEWPLFCGSLLALAIGSVIPASDRLGLADRTFPIAFPLAVVIVGLLGWRRG